MREKESERVNSLKKRARDGEMEREGGAGRKGGRGSAISAQNVAQVGLWRVLAAFVKKKRGRRVREGESI